MKTVVGAVFHLLAIIVKIVYNVLKFLRVRILALYLAVCGLVQLVWHSFAGETAVFFWIGLGLCLSLTLFGWIRYIHGKTKRARLERERERERRAGEEEEEPTGEIAAASEEKFAAYPRYYDAAGHKGYLIAEYEDRFELYKREGDSYLFIRADEKEKQDNKE